jgi:hypothetical protein
MARAEEAMTPYAVAGFGAMTVPGRYKNVSCSGNTSGKDFADAIKQLAGFGGGYFCLYHRGCHFPVAVRRRPEGLVGLDARFPTDRTHGSKFHLIYQGAALRSDDLSIGIVNARPSQKLDVFRWNS